jgi:hypothetical protein
MEKNWALEKGADAHETQQLLMALIADEAVVQLNGNVWLPIMDMILASVKTVGVQGEKNQGVS